MIRSAAFLASLLVCVWSSEASAHTNLDVNGFYQGAATVALHWEQGLLLLAAALWCIQQSDEQRPMLGAVIVTGLCCGFLVILAGLAMEQSALVGAAAYSLTGLATAARVTRIGFWLPLALGAALLNGAALGSREIPALSQPLLFAAGLAVGAALLLFYLVAALTRLPKGWPQIGVRVVGSWIAAVGVMVCAFNLYRIG